MLPWLLSVGCLMLLSTLTMLFLAKSHKESLNLLVEQAEKTRQDQKDLTNRLVALLGTKDPLAYQVVAMGPESQGFDVVSMSDEAEAQRYEQMLQDQGLDGYGTEPY